MYDDQQERFLIYETTTEYDKYYSLKFDDERPTNGVNITCFTTICKELDFIEYGRGHRGIDVDSKEFVALRNVIIFNCKDVFANSKVVRKLSFSERASQMARMPKSPSFKNEGNGINVKHK